MVCEPETVPGRTAAASSQYPTHDSTPCPHYHTERKSNPLNISMGQVGPPEIDTHAEILDAGVFCNAPWRDQLLCSKRGKINGPVRKNHSSVLVANNPVQHQRTPFAKFRNRSHLAVRKTRHRVKTRFKKERHRMSIILNRPFIHTCSCYMLSGC